MRAALPAPASRWERSPEGRHCPGGNGPLWKQIPERAAGLQCPPSPGRGLLSSERALGLGGACPPDRPACREQTPDRLAVHTTLKMIPQIRSARWVLLGRELL